MLLSEAYSFSALFFQTIFINNGSRNQQNKVISITATIFITNPAFVICLNLIWPLANTIAFGGVPIGNILAQLAASVIGIPKQ